MEQVMKSAQEAAGALKRELLQQFPSKESVDTYRGDQLKTLRLLLTVIFCI
ncbi:hypothetical protein T06_1780 [Trichinella sp. T6]|nr:hypothetical protein T06_1780 [Trichinella sp. T6]